MELPPTARHPLPQTGQTVSYDTGDDGQYEAGGRGTRWVDNGDGTITDLHSGAMWLENPAASFGGAVNWAAALAAVEGLTYAGFSDWRLPNYHEGLSLLDASKGSTPLIDDAFTFSTNIYWTSTTPGSGTTTVGFFNLAPFTAGATSKLASFWVTAVRGGVTSG